LGIDVRINVLALSYLFPNRAQPAYGIFVLHRLRAVRELCNVKVIAPIQWYPLIRLLRGALWGAGIPQREEIGGLDVYHPRFAVVPRYFKWWDALSFFWSTRSVVRRLRQQAFEFDLIDTHWTYPDIVAACLLARESGKKFIVTIRGHEALYLEENTIRRRLVAHYLRKADSVVALSEELRGKVLELGVAPQKVRVVLNGVDVTHFHQLDSQDCRRRLGLPAGRRILISVGRLAAGKGHQDLIAAFAELPANANADLYIIGGVNPEDDFRQALQALITRLGLTNVQLVDQVKHELLPLWYGAADVFCLASKREGCPNVVLESLACGTPVVVTDVGAVGEVVTDAENGFLVGPGHMASLAQAIRAALEHQWDRGAIAARMSQWGWARCAQQVHDLYEQVLRGAK
jgi:teichuronic acid biosynthesis glycosyltransferase TuaC